MKITLKLILKFVIILKFYYNIKLNNINKFKIKNIIIFFLIKFLTLIFVIFLKIINKK